MGALETECKLRRVGAGGGASRGRNHCALDVLRFGVWGLWSMVFRVSSGLGLMVFRALGFRVYGGWVFGFSGFRCDASLCFVQRSASTSKVSQG